jgi:hypothetical protein
MIYSGAELALKQMPHLRTTYSPSEMLVIRTLVGEIHPISSMSLGKSTVEVGALRRSLDTSRHFGTYRASRWVNRQRSESFLISKTAHLRSSPNTSSIAIVRLPLIWIIRPWIIRCAAPALGRCWLPSARGSPQRPEPPTQEAQSHLPTVTHSTASLRKAGWP